MDPNRPDIAIQAASRALNSASQSEASDSEMDIDESEANPFTVNKASGAQDLVSTAQAANDQLRLVAGEEPPGDSSYTNISPEGSINGISKSLQNSFQPSPDKREPSDHAVSPTLGGSTTAIGRKVSNDAVDGLLKLKEPSPKRHRTNGDLHVPPTAATIGDSLATSPTMRNNTMPVSQRSPQQTLPAIQAHSPSKSHSSSSPRGERNLPPLSQLTQLAEAAEKEAGTPTYDSRSNGMMAHTRHSFSSTSGGAGQSPPTKSAIPASQDRRMPGPFPNGKIQGPMQPSQYQQPYPPPQSSPASSYSEVSPHETFRQSHDPAEVSPQPPPSHQGSHPYYYKRRASQATENAPPYAAASSESHPSTESFSPATNPTPGDHRTSIDSNQLSNGHAQQQPMGPLAAGGFKCDYPSCSAPPFQTQYLLNSHANVHSQNRPHYCPVKGCPRGEGGKGFKRKNEMIRHGLVHDSPGYVCPFCPDREHKYPRPDNLQR
ncbi:MAG: hypothetical protein M1836_000352 [Candelina mexicana]|nr:MAG: hypothetical protein M1836_000352 [Candelina mexicana]